MAFEFNGTNQFLVSFSGAPATGPPFAFSAWFWRDTSTNGTLFALASGDNWFRSQTRSVDNFLQASVSDGFTVSTAITTTAAAPGAWHHAFVVFGSTSSRKIWLNGGGEGSNTDLKPVSPANATFLGVEVSATIYLDGRLAEVAFWAGSGTETMGINEANVLAAGFSPTCLTSRLKNLAFYQPLVRDLNWNRVGLSLTPANSPTVTNHPRIIYPGREDFFLRSPGAGSAGRVTPQGIIPFGLNFER